MSFVIDGHNLIGALPDVDLADPDDEARLLVRLRQYRSHTGDVLIVFFDSGDMPTHQVNLSSPGVQVRFAQPGQSADDAIIAFLAGRAQPGQYAVVTNDHELAYRARTAGASVISATDFALRLRRPAKQSPPKAEPGPDPHDPNFADIYADFLAAADQRFNSDDAPRDAGVWIERLYGDDLDQAQKAARWLGHHGGEAALDALRDALTHDDARVRAAAALALGDLRHEAAVVDLAGCLSGDPASMVREAAAQSLGRLYDSRAVDALELAVNADPKSKVRKAARQALLQLRARRS